MTRVALTPGFVIHRRPYRESSLLLEVFARHYGRLGLLARGARQPRSRRAQLLQPFVPLQLAWSGRGELPVLTGVEADGRPLLSPLDARAVIALYLNELLLRLNAREDPHPALFDAYQRALTELAGDAIADQALRRFELSLLESMGYGLQLTHEALSGAPIEAGGAYLYVHEQGPVAASAQAGAGTPVSGATLLGLAAGGLESAVQRREARILLRGAIQHYLGGRPLKTRELLKSLNRVRSGRDAGERRL